MLGDDGRDPGVQDAARSSRRPPASPPSTPSRGTGRGAASSPARPPARPVPPSRRRGSGSGLAAAPRGAPPGSASSRATRTRWRRRRRARRTEASRSTIAALSCHRVAGLIGRARPRRPPRATATTSAGSRPAADSSIILGLPRAVRSSAHGRRPGASPSADSTAAPACRLRPSTPIGQATTTCSWPARDRRVDSRRHPPEEAHRQLAVGVDGEVGGAVEHRPDELRAHLSGRRRPSSRAVSTGRRRGHVRRRPPRTHRARPRGRSRRRSSARRARRAIPGSDSRPARASGTLTELGTSRSSSAAGCASAIRVSPSSTRTVPSPSRLTSSECVQWDGAPQGDLGRPFDEASADRGYTRHDRSSGDR